MLAHIPQRERRKGEEKRVTQSGSRCAEEKKKSVEESEVNAKEVKMTNERRARKGGGGGLI